MAEGRNLITAFFLSLKQVHSDILVKDEICLEGVIRTYTEAEQF